jgi:hypothetical protein
MFPRLTRGRWLLAVVLLSALAAGCNGDDGGNTAPPSSAGSVPATVPEATLSGDPWPEVGASAVVPPIRKASEAPGGAAGAPGVGRAITPFIRQVDDVFRAAKGRPLLGGSADDATNVTIKQLIESAPPSTALTPDETYALQRLRALYFLRTTPRATLTTLDQRWSTAVSRVDDLVSRHATRLTGEHYRLAKGFGEAILRDIGCSLLWNAMNEDYRAFANNLVQNGYTAAFTDVMQAIWNQTETAAKETIVKEAESGFAYLLGGPAAKAVNWVNYVDDLWKHGEDIQQNGGLPVGGLPAMTGYVRLCLRPPV